MHALIGDRWPERLWICAVRRTDGVRTVFGRPESPQSPLAAAVLASCAIPAYFAPVTIGGVEYFDGGVHSLSNADVLTQQRPDVVIVVSPMSSGRLAVGSPAGLIRWSAHRRLERGTRRLEAAGCVVVRVEPGSSSVGAMGLNMMSDRRSSQVVEAAIVETVRAIDGRRIPADLIPRQSHRGDVRLTSIT